MRVDEMARYRAARGEPVVEPQPYLRVRWAMIELSPIVSPSSRCGTLTRATAAVSKICAWLNGTPAIWRRRDTVRP